MLILSKKILTGVKSKKKLMYVFKRWWLNSSSLCTQFWLEHVDSYVVQAKYVFYLQWTQQSF